MKTYRYRALFARRNASLDVTFVLHGAASGSTPTLDQQSAAAIARLGDLVSEPALWVMAECVLLWER